MNKSIFSNIKNDLPASLVVFLVAVPLCLGIALGSDAPAFAGIIAGIIGGIIVGVLSGSALGVSGPAAGLIVIVADAIKGMPSYETFLLAVVVAGLIQLLFGFLKAGVIGYYFPTSVIKGMLTAIGITILLKQIPHALGYDKDFEGDLTFTQADGFNTFTEILNFFYHPELITQNALIIAVISLGVLILWETKFFKKIKLFKIIQGPLIVVILGVLLNQYFMSIGKGLGASHRVNLPLNESLQGFASNFSFPDFSMIFSPDVWVTGFIIALVASLETLLSVEATDKIDPVKRITPTNRELKAQGVGNILSGMIGGLPITQVIVRSSANIQSGGKTKLSAIIHGFLILISVLLIPDILNMIPTASLAAILLMVGYKLAKPRVFKEMYKAGPDQIIPFLITVIAIVLTDLLIGISIGMGVGILYILYNNMKTPYHFDDAGHDGETIKIHLSENLSFLNKAALLDTFKNIPDGSKVILNFDKTINIDYDVKEVLENFKENAEFRKIDVSILGVNDKKVLSSLKRFKNMFPSQITK
jgi:MFS superfamily sulfate permease-like transporter